MDLIVRAYSEIPDEYLLLEDRLAVSKYLVGLRGCGKHYWVRSNGVPSHLPCEQCGVTRQMEQQVLQGIPEVFPTSTTKEEPPISQYIWKGWRDQRPHSIRIHLISIHLPIHPSIHPSIHPPIHPPHVSIYQYIIISFLSPPPHLQVRTTRRRYGGTRTSWTRWSC